MPENSGRVLFSGPPQKAKAELSRAAFPAAIETAGDTRAWPRGEAESNAFKSRCT